MVYVIEYFMSLLHSSKQNRQAAMYYNPKAWQPTDLPMK